MEKHSDEITLGSLTKEWPVIHEWKSANWRAREALLMVRDTLFPNAHVFSFDVGEWGIYQQDNSLVALIQLECSSDEIRVENTRISVYDEDESEGAVEKEDIPNDYSADDLAQEIFNTLESEGHRRSRLSLVPPASSRCRCQAEGCKLPGDFEVFYFDLYPELKEVWCQPYKGCSVLCERHVLENEIYGRWGRKHKTSGYLYTPNAGEKMYSMASYRPLPEWIGVKD